MGAGDAASLITIDIAIEKRGVEEHSRGGRLGDGELREGEDPCSLFN